MVCAAILCDLTPNEIDAVEDMVYEVVETDEPSFESVAETVGNAVSGLDEGVVVSEEGEFYSKPEWVVEGALESEFKYVESIGERKAVDLAHHAAYAARNLLISKDSKINKE